MPKKWNENTHFACLDRLEYIASKYLKEKETNK